MDEVVITDGFLQKKISDDSIGPMRKTSRATSRIPMWTRMDLVWGPRPCSSRPQQMSRRTDSQVPSTIGTAASDDVEVAGAARKVPLPGSSLSRLSLIFQRSPTFFAFDAAILLRVSIS